MAYPLGWSMIPHLQVQRERWPGGYMLKARPLVQPGQEVLPDQPVLRIEEHQKTVEPLTQEISASRLSSSPHSMPGLVLSGLRGRVVELTPRGGVVIESRVAVVQGKLGVGHQVAGRLMLWNGREIDAAARGTILVVPGHLSFSLMRQALEAGVSGIVASSASVRDLEGFLHADIVQLLMCRDVEQAYSHVPPLTLLLTEGPGEFTIPERIKDLVRQYAGAFALLSGITSVACGLVPELAISLPPEEGERADWRPVQPRLTLGVGVRARVNSGEYAGLVGEIDHLFVYGQVFTSGIRARAARLRLESGSTIVVPLALLEPIG